MKRMLCLAAIVWLAIPAAATSIRRLRLDEVRDRAESIFVARVLSSSTRAVANGRLTAIDYVVHVTEVLRGEVPFETTITFAALDVAPAIEMGREYVFFRTGQPNNTTVGWRQGLFSIEVAHVGGVDRTVLISGDGEALVKAGGSVARGQRIVVRNRQIVSLSVERDSDPVSEFGQPEGSGIRHLPANAAAKVMTPDYATLDDLRAFVAAKQVKP